jgi:hypothetical protein
VVNSVPSVMTTVISWYSGWISCFISVPPREGAAYSRHIAM